MIFKIAGSTAEFPIKKKGENLHEFSYSYLIPYTYCA